MARGVEKKELTEQELVIAKMIALGWDNHRIVKRLDISIKTYDTHRLHIMTKLGFSGTAAEALLARHAIKLGWVTTPFENVKDEIIG